MPYKQETIKPYATGSAKGKQVAQMFDAIAPHYDLLNHLLSFGIDRQWRRKAIDTLATHRPKKLLDVATGTADFALLAARRIPSLTSLTGVDLSEAMLTVGREKIAKAKLACPLTLQTADCMHLPFEPDTFDAITVAYGVRNFESLDQGLREMRRVLCPGGHLLILELAIPPRGLMRALFWLYAHVAMPLVGRLVSGDKKAYTYLPATMEAFPQAETMEKILRGAGFKNVIWKRFTLGLCTMYMAS